MQWVAGALLSCSFSLHGSGTCGMWDSRAGATGACERKILREGVHGATELLASGRFRTGARGHSISNKAAQAYFKPNALETYAFVTEKTSVEKCICIAMNSLVKNRITLSLNAPLLLRAIPIRHAHPSDDEREKLGDSLQQLRVCVHFTRLGLVCIWPYAQFAYKMFFSVSMQSELKKGSSLDHAPFCAQLTRSPDATRHW